MVGVNGAVFVDREEHRAFEPVPLAENFRQHRQPFLGAIFFVAREKDDVPAHAGAGFALINGPVCRASARDQRKQPEC